jgi:hypothetical protein
VEADRDVDDVGSVGWIGIPPDPDAVPPQC